MRTGTRTAKFDAVLNLFASELGLSGFWIYNTDLFDRATLERLTGHLRMLIAGAAAEPDRPLAEVPLLSAAELRQLLVEWNPGPSLTAEPERFTLHEHFAAWAAATPGAPAVSFDGVTLTYAELSLRANRIAHFLINAGVRPGDLVGLYLDRSPALVAAILGVLKAGASYLPLDPVYPAERVAFALADSRVAVLLTQESLAGNLPRDGAWVLRLDADAHLFALESGDDPRVEVPPGFPAYVIYTSGSTGKPKGVMVTHENVARLFTATDGWYGFGPDDVWTLFHSYAFDFSVWELWGALLYGGRLVVVPYWVSRSPEAFCELLRSEQVTVLSQTPSAFRQVIWAEEATRGQKLALRFVVFGGEALELASLRPWLDRHGDEKPRLVNMYGITETTVHVTYREIRRADVEAGTGSVIGRPIPDLSVHLLDAAGQLVPVGVPGEIHVGGAGVTAGYLGRPELTAQRFVPDPFAGKPGARLYRSGDLARRLSDGDLEYLGRIDHQVKIRGFRIELGEIETAVASFPGVRETVVLVRDQRLLAYVVADPAPSLHDVREALGRGLPDYMLPSALVVLDALPLTANGKVDRRALPDLEVDRADRGFVEPSTVVEKLLARLFREVLKVDRAGIHDDFFELGGSSITGAVLINRLQQELGEIVQVVVIFDAPTVAQLAGYLKAEHPAALVRLFGAEAGVDLPAAGSESRVDAVRVAEMCALIQPLPAAPIAEKNPPAVFVLSAPRSGSTLLRVMLGGHPGLFAPPELELLSFNTMAERRAEFSGRDSFWLEGLIRGVMEVRGWGPDEAREHLEAWERDGLSTHEAYGRLQEWLDGRILVDKTPSYALDPAILRRAEESFDGAKYVHLLRHPHGMIRSFEEAKLDQIFFRREHPFSRRELAELIWLVSEQNIVEFLRGIPAERQHLVRFEELVADPERVLRGLCAFLGIFYHADMAAPYKDKSSRMTDGPHAQSRMLGDVKFHEHKGVDAKVAERWKQDVAEDFLGGITRGLAEALGYRFQAAKEEWTPILRRQDAAGTPLPLSFSQERLWFLDQLDPGQSTYNIPGALRLAGRLDVQALESALAGVMRRHDALRTTFAAGPVQIVSELDPAAVLLPVVDLSGLPESDGEAHRVVIEEAMRPFDLARGPLLRATLLRLAAEDHVALLDMHHIVSDGWSMGILIREIAALYQASPLPELSIQYTDFAVWQRGSLQGPKLEAEIGWWRERLAHVPPLDLPTDRPHPPVQTFHGASVPFAIAPELAQATHDLGRREDATLFMTALAAFVVLLRRYSGQGDIAVGTPNANRNRREVEDLIGFFVNTLVLRADASGDPALRTLLARVREAAVGAFAHQDVPFEKVVEELRPERDLSRSPLFQVMFVLQNLQTRPLQLPGLTISLEAFEAATAKFELTLTLWEGEAGLTAAIEYNTDLFDRPTIERMGRHFQMLLAGAAAEPDARISDLPLLTTAEERQLLEEWNATGIEHPRGVLVHELFVAQAARTPERPAVSFGGKVLTYRDLDQQSNRLANHLRRLGVGPETLVGLCVERSERMVVGLLGILKSGGAYVPLDPTHPAERIAMVLEDAGVAVLLSDDFPDLETESSDAPAPWTDEESLAYVIYTSGSTGRPKGVQLPHRTVVNFLRAMAMRPGFGADDVIPALTTLSFEHRGSGGLPAADAGRPDRGRLPRRGFRRPASGRADRRVGRDRDAGDPCDLEVADRVGLAGAGRIERFVRRRGAAARAGGCAPRSRRRAVERLWPDRDRDLVGHRRGRSRRPGSDRQSHRQHPLLRRRCGLPARARRSPWRAVDCR